jgi:hypothetical protein
MTTNAAPRRQLRDYGSLKKYEKFDVTTNIGTEFKPGMQLSDIITAPNSDDMINDLALLGTTNYRRHC